MKTEYLKRIILVLAFATALVFGTSRSADAQRRIGGDQDRKKNEQISINDWFGSEEYRKKVLEERQNKEPRFSRDDARRVSVQEIERRKEARNSRDRKWDRSSHQRYNRRRIGFLDNLQTDNDTEIIYNNDTEKNYNTEIPAWQKEPGKKLPDWFGKESDTESPAWVEKVKWNLWKDSHQSLFKKVESSISDREKTLQSQNRLTELGFQQEYLARLKQDKLALEKLSYSYKSEKKDYRYLSQGIWREITKSGAEMLQQAVKNGYEEGIRAGQADRLDGWKTDSENSYSYQDAVYGYDNFYVELNEYQYYFRQGFWRGYEDGYYKRSNYGKQEKGKFSVLETVLQKIIDIKS